MPAERVGLGEGAGAAIIFITFVAGDNDDGAVVFVFPQRLEHVSGAEDVGGGGFQWRVVRAPHERLGGEIENDVGLCFGSGLFDQIKIADVPDGFTGESFGREGFVEIGRGVRGKGEAVDVRAEVAQPQAEPRALEAGVAGDQVVGHY